MGDGPTGILFAVPGTTCPEAAGVFRRIDRAAEARFPGVARYWGYTSAGVRRKAAAQGCRLDDPAAALAAARGRGIGRMAVLPLHLSDGIEYSELRETAGQAETGAAPFARMTLGAPLLVSADAWRRTVDAVWQETADAGRGGAALILVAHGSRETPERFAAAAATCRATGRQVFFGAMQCPPGIEDVSRACREAGVRRAWLLPCMVAAGYSAREGIMGAGTTSWRSALERGGVECVPVIKGLGEFEGVVRVWMDQAGELLAALDRAA
jgi:sirohydrochlorin cobaltochelatase